MRGGHSQVEPADRRDIRKGYRVRVDANRVLENKVQKLVDQRLRGLCPM